MKKLVLLSFVAILAIVTLSSFVRLNNQPENKLAKNKDFINWFIAIKSLKIKVENSHSKMEFIGFLNKTNTALQNEKLVKAMDLKSEQEIVTILNKINFYKTNFVKATPELLTAKGAEIIQQALQENMQVVPPTCWETYTIRSMNCLSLYTEIWEREVCEAAAWNALMSCVDPPILPENN